MKDGGQADLNTEKSNLDHGDDMFFDTCLTSTRPVSERKAVLRATKYFAEISFVSCIPLTSICFVPISLVLLLHGKAVATGTHYFLSHGGDILDLKILIQRLRSAFVLRWSRIRSSTILLFFICD